MDLPTKLSPSKFVSRAGIFVSVALVLSVLESSIGVFALAPGMKIGLANIVTMIALFSFGPFFALCVGLLRALLASIFSGAITMFFYSGLGTVLCVIAMQICQKKLKPYVSEIGTSMIGAFFFNVGQVIVSALALQSIHIFSYLPALTFVSTFCGLFTGYIAKKIMEAQHVK